MNCSYDEGQPWKVLADSGYPLEPWTMTPILGARAGSAEARYTTAHAKGRNCIERLSGVVKSRFRCINAERVLRYDPKFIGQLVNVVRALHNMCKDASLPDFPTDIRRHRRHPTLRRQRNRFFVEGKRIRQRIINTYY